MTKDTSEAEPEGHSNTNATPPRPPTPPKPEGKDSQLDSKIDSLEEKIRLIQGLNSFGNTDFSSMSWFPNMTVPPKFKAPEFEKYNGRGDPMIHLQMDYKMQFFVDLIPVGERIEDALKTKKIVDMTALMALAEQAAKKAPTKRKEGDVQMIGRSNGRPRQSPPNFHHAIGTTKAYSDPGSDSGSSPGPSTPDAGKAGLTTAHRERTSTKNLTCDFHFGEVGHAIGNCNHLRHRVQDLIDHGILKFEGLPNITTNPLPNHPEGGVNMVEIEEGNEERILWRRLFYTLEKKRHITPLEAPPGPSTGDACEYHSGARGHSLECCEEFKKKITNLMENGLVGREEIPSERSHQPEDPSDFDWMKEADWGYFMEDDTDEWKDVDFTKLFQFTYLIVPPGFETPEFEIFYENGDPEVHLQKYGEKMALHLENELLMISVFPESLSKQAAAWKMKSPTSSLTREWDEVIVEIKEEPSVLSLPALTEGEEEEEVKPLPPAKDPDNATIAEEGEGATQGTTAKQSSPPPLLKKNMLALWLKEPREVKIGTRCAAEQKEALIALLREFHEIFAWSYQDMPGLDTDIVVHKIPLKPECKPVKQALRRMKPEVILKIKEEVEKQLKAGFLSTVTYSDWVANIVPVPKKDGKVRMCVDYRDLNRASPKDNFPLPHIDTLVDNTATNVVFSFMDGFSGYNQIKMAEEDKSKTAFITHWGTFVYDVMPFGLKNAGATYQRAMVTLFHDMIHHEIEVYVDDMIAKSRTAQDHLTDLRKLFQRLKKYQLRLNPNKCAFGVTSGKLLGFIVSGRGIEIDPAKVQAIRSMPAPKTEKEIRSFLGRINYIARFIAQLTATCEPLFKLLRKDVKIKWTEDCQRAFDKIKEYLLNPPILVPPTPGRPLILYLTVQEASMGCMLGQQDETGKKEQAIYYLSKKFTEPETRYLLVEKTCCALAWASKKLRQYMLYYTTWLAIKGQAIADYLADYPSEQLELMDSEFPDEDVMTVDEDNHGRWKLYFDGAANAVGSGIGAVLVSPKGQQTPIAVKLGFDCTNNMTEYEACIVGLQAALEFGAYELEVFGDSLLIVSQTNGEWQARDPKLIPYQRYISRLVPKFKYVTFTYTPRAHNHFADALATLASLIKLVEGDDVRPLRIETRDIPAYCVCIEECMNVEAEIDNKPWYYDIKRFIQDREYPPRATENEKKVHQKDGLPVLLERRDSPMPTDPSWPGRFMRAGYYWLTMERDCIRHVQTCHKCQMYQNSKNAPPQYLHTMASPWPFSAWGMDVIGAITPKASNGHEFILVAIDYFTKWVEACSFKNVTQVAVTRFVKNNIICRYGMPEDAHHRQCFQPKQPHDGSAMPAVQDPAPQLCSIPSEDERSRRSCQQELRTSVGATPYSLVYGMEAVLPVEVEIPSLRILSQTQLEEAEWAQATLYQRRIERAYNKKARPRTFQPGDLVLKKRNMALSDPRGKFAPSYEGPYVVKKAFSGGAIILADMDGEEFRSPINSDSVIKPGKQRKSVRTLPSDGNYRGYGENLGRGAIGKSNVESWTWRLSAESPQGSGKGRIPLIMLLPDGASSGTQRIHHLVNLVKRSDHRETLLIEPRSIGLKSIMHQIQLGLQNPVVTLENANLNPHDPHGSTRRRERLLTRI
uniref:RNase H type-1 domain-containing protein n=1 Tax=Fagus sylvatica TaxID=28930 RepID=A0A2N9GYX8_FAGSY